MKKPEDFKILVGCEESQAVCIAFRELGFEAYSCDLLPCSGGHPEWHIQGNVVNQLYKQWDLIIAFPPCDRLANSGVRWLAERQLWDEMYFGCEFFNIFQSLGESGVKVAIENPIQHKYAREYISKYDQIIQPYQFGHMEKKATCLWLYGLPKLTETNNVYCAMMKLPYKDRAKIHYCSPGPNRSILRAKTFPGIANAMAEQWGNYLLNSDL